MTEYEFSNQINRLENQFGKYGAERGRMLWLRVQDFSDGWFRSVIDRFLGNFRQNPLPDDFGLEIANERDRLRKLGREQEPKAKDTWLYCTEAEKEHCSEMAKLWMPFIRRAVAGQVPEDEMNDALAANGIPVKKTQEK